MIGDTCMWRCTAGVDVWACGVVLLEMLCGLNQLNRMLGRSRSPSVNPEEFVELKRFFNDGPGIKPALKDPLRSVRSHSGSSRISIPAMGVRMPDSHYFSR